MQKVWSEGRMKALLWFSVLYIKQFCNLDHCCAFSTSLPTQQTTRAAVMFLHAHILIQRRMNQLQWSIYTVQNEQGQTSYFFFSEHDADSHTFFYFLCKTTCDWWLCVWITTHTQGLGMLGLALSEEGTPPTSGEFYFWHSLNILLPTLSVAPQMSVTWGW